MLLGSSFVFVCDSDFSVIKNGGVVYENGEIIEVGIFEELRAKYQNLDSRFYEDSVLLPAFINAHIHFEFGANHFHFDYGGFPQWLSSVMKNRDDVLDKIDSIICDEISSQLECGVGSVGAISSYGLDMQALAQSPLKVVYFNEAIGSNPAAIDMLFSDFKARFERSLALSSSTFFPAIAIHSPYSVHNVLARHIINIAKANQSLLSTHFLESKAEREWLSHGKGWFLDFYTNVLKIPNPKPFYTIDEFFELFSGLRAVFVHMTNATQSELRATLDSHHSIITCPRSNKLLDGKFFNLNALRSATKSTQCKAFDVDSLDSANLDSARIALASNSPTSSTIATHHHTTNHLAIGTDGMSSNFNLNLLDELRAGLLCMDTNIENLAKELLLMATHNGAKALNLNNGILQKGRLADFAIFHIPHITNSTQPHLHFIMSAQKVSTLILSGKVIL